MSVNALKLESAELPPPPPPPPPRNPPCKQHVECLLKSVLTAADSMVTGCTEQNNLSH